MPVDVMTDDRAGRILAPACKLSTTRASDTNFRCFEKTYTGSATTYRNYLVEKLQEIFSPKAILIYKMYWLLCRNW